MKCKILLVLPLLLIACNIFAGKIEGRVINVVTNQPIGKATVNIKKSSLYGTTNQDGYFYIDDVPNGNIILTIVAADIKNNQFPIEVKEGNNTLGDLKVMILDDEIKAIDESTIFAFAESDLEDDDYSQGYVSLLGSSNDVFIKNTNYQFFVARYRNRGLESQYETGYINGIKFNDAERGRFNYSMFAGLNDATRNKDAINGLYTSSYSYGDISGVNNIDTRASQYQQGGKVTVSATNRSYVGRVAATYATGILNNGWAFVGSVAARGALPHDMAGGIFSGYMPGMHYASLAGFFAAEKIFNESHSLNITAFGGYTDRSQSSAATEEVYNLTGSHYYNPNWGIDNGNVRNARVVNSTDPTLLINHIWHINKKSKLTSGIAVKYSQYATTALNWNNPVDPRPDYYRNLPSFNLNTVGGSNSRTYDPFNNTNQPTDKDIADAKILEDKWHSGNLQFTQINFGFMRNSNINNAETSYMIEQRNNNQIMARLNSVFDTRLNKHIKFVVGIDAGTTKGMHYKKVSDLLGGNDWLDIDHYAIRDGLGPNIAQNDLNNPNRKVKVGDIFGYNYNMHVTDANLWGSALFEYKHIDAFVAVKGSYSTFVRDGLMRNGRAYHFDANDNPIDSVQSFGVGKSHHFGNYGVKGGITYKINGKHFISANIGYETRAPYAYNAYVSPRIKDTPIDFLTSEKILSADISYIFRTQVVSGRVSAFYNGIWDQSKFISFYHDDFRTLVNHVLTGMNRRHLGAEVGLQFKLSDYFKLNAAFVYGDYVYTSNPTGTITPENGREVSDFNKEGQEKVIISGFNYTLQDQSGNVQEVKIDAFKVSGTPQMAATLGLSFFHPTMWFADLNINYFDNAYLDFSTLRRTQSSIDETIKHAQEALDAGNVGLDQAVSLTQEIFQQERLSSKNFWDNLTVDVSIGKALRFKNGMMLNLNLTVQNIINNTNMKTGGYEQARFDRSGSFNVSKYPPKYYYAFGTNFFLNIGWRF